jgi:hypothetical protein
LPVQHAHKAGASPASRDQRVLELFDFACLKINESEPWRRVLIMCQFQSGNVSSIGIDPPAATRFTTVSGVAAFGRPGLMIFLTVVPQSARLPFNEGGQAMAVPLLQRLTGERLTGAVALICENGDFVHKVGMVRPADWDDIGDVPDMLVVQPGDDSLQPQPDLSSQLRRLAGPGIPWPRQSRQISQRQKAILVPACCEIEFSIDKLH